MDIGSGAGYPASALSNFAPHPFTFTYDGVTVECASMEGLLQSFKFPYPDVQREVCKLVGRAAKFKGKKRKWQSDQTLYWNGKPIKRKSQEYQELLDAAFAALATNDGFCKALLATGSAVLTHSMGKSDERQTVLTEREFCSRLTRIRERLQK